MLCQYLVTFCFKRKTSQSIRTIKIFREKRDLYGLSTNFYRLKKKWKWKTCDEKKKKKKHGGFILGYSMNIVLYIYTYEFLFTEVSIIRRGIRYFSPEKKPLPNPFSQESIKNQTNPLRFSTGNIYC